MADFAEYLPFDAELYDISQSASSLHNVFPQLWAQVNHVAVQNNVSCV